MAELKSLVEHGYKPTPGVDSTLVRAVLLMCSRPLGEAASHRSHKVASLVEKHVPPSPTFNARYIAPRIEKHMKQM